MGVANVRASLERRSSSSPRLLLLLFLLLAFGLRLFLLQDANIWWDEGFSVYEARMGMVELARRTAVDVHPPFYYWLLHFWRLAVGDGEFTLRFLSAALGVLTVAAVWSLGRRLAPRWPWAALIGVVLLTFSRYAVSWSQEIRMYALSGLLVTLSLYFTVRLRQRPSWTLALAYVLITAASLWTLYILAFLLVIESLYWLWTLRTIGVWRGRLRSLLMWGVLQVDSGSEFSALAVVRPTAHVALVGARDARLRPLLATLRHDVARRHRHPHRAHMGGRSDGWSHRVGRDNPSAGATALPAGA